MRVVVIKLNDEVVPAEVVGYLPLKRRTGESSPEDLLPFHHRLVRLGNAPV